MHCIPGCHGGGGGGIMRPPQSAQSVPRAHHEYQAPGPPSSQMPEIWEHSLVHRIPGCQGGGEGAAIAGSSSIDAIAMGIQPISNLSDRNRPKNWPKNWPSGRHAIIVLSSPLTARSQIWNKRA